MLALWSGSRALNVFVDTITIMHGLGGHRGIVRTRALSFVALRARRGHRRPWRSRWSWPARAWCAEWLPQRLDFVMGFYWPMVLVLCVCFLATLYHVSVPVRTAWTLQPAGGDASRWSAGSSAPTCCGGCSPPPPQESRSIYGPLAAPIAVLLWLYILAIAVLIGAAVNAAFDTVFPQKATSSARLERVQRLRSRITMRES